MNNTFETAVTRLAEIKKQLEAAQDGLKAANGDLAAHREASVRKENFLIDQRDRFAARRDGLLQEHQQAVQALADARLSEPGSTPGGQDAADTSAAANDAPAESFGDLDAIEGGGGPDDVTTENVSAQVEHGNSVPDETVLNASPGVTAHFAGS